MELFDLKWDLLLPNWTVEELTTHVIEDRDRGSSPMLLSPKAPSPINWNEGLGSAFIILAIPIHSQMFLSLLLFSLCQRPEVGNIVFFILFL
jgi:hypothetical protein